MPAVAGMTPEVLCLHERENALGSEALSSQTEPGLRCARLSSWRFSRYWLLVVTDVFPEFSPPGPEQGRRVGPAFRVRSRESGAPHSAGPVRSAEWGPPH